MPLQHALHDRRTRVPELHRDEPGGVAGDRTEKHVVLGNDDGLAFRLCRKKGKQEKRKKVTDFMTCEIHRTLTRLLIFPPYTTSRVAR